MFTRSIGICATLLSMPLLSLAQSSEVAVPRYYIGLSASTNSYQRQSRELDNSTVPPLQLTLGYQLRPRWAVQVSASYSHSPGFVTSTLYDSNENYVGEYSNAYRNTALTVTALGRYTLTRDLSHRFQLDALGGLMFDHLTHRQEGYLPDAVTGEQRSFAGRSKTTHKALSVGPSFRYRLFSSLEAVGEGTVNMDLRALRMVTTSGAIGLRYGFGR